MQSIIERFQSARESWFSVPDTARQQDQVWFAGLAVSPVEFSRQLSSLQVSLQRESVPAKGQPALH